MMSKLRFLTQKRLPLAFGEAKRQSPEVEYQNARTALLELQAKFKRELERRAALQRS